MTVLPNTGMTLPVRGAPGSGLWGDTIDADLQLLDAHDHTTGKGLPITTAAISINADLPFSSLWAPTQLHRVQFSNIAAGALTAGQRKSLYASDGTSGGVANELYWINNAGNKVQITSGNTLNFAAFVGGIGGDYTSVGATLNYNDGQKAYEFKEGAIDSNGWARLRCGDVRMFPFNTTGATYVGMAAPAGIGGTYTVTWPLALPGTTQLMAIDSTGQVAFAATGPVGAITLAANANLTVSGTGELKHGNRTLIMPGCHGFVASGTATISALDGSVNSTAALSFVVTVPLKTGDRVQSVTIARFGDGSVDATVNVIKTTTGASSSTIATVTITNPAASWNDSTATVGSPAALAAGEQVIIAVLSNAANFGHNNVRVVYDRP